MKRNVLSTTIFASVFVLASLALPRAAAMPTQAQSLAALAPRTAGQVEPLAGTWPTWVLTSGSQLRLPPPPSRAKTRLELRALRALVAQRNAAALDQIAFWNAGAPGYRWNELATNMAIKHNMPQTRAMRALALLNVAISDATVAAWDSKYTYHRLRPSALDSRIQPVLLPPASPSYPSEHAVAAGAAAQVLAYLFPADAQSFMDAATAAGRSRLLAGVQYPSDVTAGLALGREVGNLVVARAKTDGSDIPWSGSVPTTPGHWIGTNPLEPTLGSWKPWVLTSGSQLRPGPPPAFDSAQEAAELTELKTFAHTPATDRAAYFWQFPYPTAMPQVQYFYAQAAQKVFEERLDANPPQAARVYALVGVAIHDSFVGCWDAKYTYWAPRPSMVDPSIKPLFANPNHPSYPSSHACESAAVMSVLGYLFPRDATHFTQLAQEAGMSRLVAGIHFRSDVEAGFTLGRGVGALVIAHDQSKHR